MVSRTKDVTSRCSQPLPRTFTKSEPRKDKHGIDLISDALPFGRLWYDTPDHAIGYAMHFSRSADAVIRVYDVAGNVIQTLDDKGDFKAW